jgi:hypothetical protein
MKSEPDIDASFAAFVRAAKAQGMTDEFIVSLLRQNGWSERRIFRTYSSYYTGLLGTPLPGRPPGAGSARDAFYYLLNFITLGFWTVSLGQIFYMVIAKQFPDAVDRLSEFQSFREAISWQLACVIVAFPIFLFIHGRIQRELHARPDLYDSGVRRWLTYIALVLAALIVLCDAVWFFQALIRGELTVRFILDSLVLLVLGGGVFTYYLRTIDSPAAA